MTDFHEHEFPNAAKTVGYVRHREWNPGFVEDDYFNESVLTDRLCPHISRSYLGSRRDPADQRNTAPERSPQYRHP